MSDPTSNLTDLAWIQVNTRGAWKNVCQFHLSRRAEVREAVYRMALAIRNPAGYGKWCFLFCDGSREWIKIKPAPTA